jgi:sugar O-acyltransferase (sialic acid O-acetyltransferase NeuD family)
MKLAIFGTGGMGRELADIVNRSLRLRSRYAEIVFTTDDPGAPVQGIRVVHPDSLAPEDEISLALGSSSARRALAARLAGRRFATIVSDHAIVSPSARLGEGATVCDFAVINSNAVIGRHFQANVHAQVSHDAIIGDYVTFAPQTSCNGWVDIGDDVSVGAGAVIRNGTPQRRLRIGQGATVGMGAVVLRDIPPGRIALGTGLREG